MSNEVDLKLVADAKPYVDSVKQAMNANQQLHNQIKQGYEAEKSAVKEIQRAIAELTLAKQKTTNPKEQERYNQKIKEAKFELAEASKNMKNYKDAIDETDESQKKSEKSQSLLSQGWVKMVGLIGGVMGVWRGFKSIMESTQTTADGFAVAMAGLGGAIKSVLSDVAQLEFSGMIERMRSAAEGAMEHEKVLDEMTDRANAVEIRRSKLTVQIMEAQMNMREALMLKDYENFNKYKSEYLALSEQLVVADAEIQKSILESYEKNIIGKKLIRDQSNGNLRELNENEIALVKKFIEEYDKLSENELQSVNKVVEERKKAEKIYADLEEDRARRAAASRGANQSFTQSELKRINESKAAFEEQKAGLSGLALEYYNLESVLDRFVDADRTAYKQLLINRYNSANEMTNVNKSIQRMDLMAQSQQLADAKAAGDKEKERIKQLGDEILKLEDENEKKRIERLTGSERFAAEEQYQLNQIAKTKAYLETLGTLDANALRTIATMEQNVRDERKQKEIDFQQEILEINQSEAEKQVQIAQKKADELKAIDDNIADYQRQVELSMADFVDKTGLQRMIVTRNHKQAEVDALKELYLEQVMSADEANKKLAQITMAQIELGNNEVQSLDEQIRQKKLKLSDYAHALQTAFNTVTGMLQSTYNAQLQFFQRERQMMDTRIGELQRTIDQEIEARDKGYANNVEGKKKELEKLQAERDKAFEKEKKVAEAQRKLNEVIQVSNLITASAQIFNTYSLIPGGTILAISLIALMLGAYIKAKVDAKKYASLGEGGSGNKTGIITGKKHSQGGENFLDHVEVESGESWGVLAANKVPKYGQAFHSIVKAMNEGRLELRPHFKMPQSNNTVIVNNDNKRMQSLENAMRDVERAIKDQPQIYYSGGKRIEKKGRNTRIIYEKN